MSNCSLGKWAHFAGTVCNPGTHSRCAHGKASAECGQCQQHFNAYGHHHRGCITQAPQVGHAFRIAVQKFKQACAQQAIGANQVEQAHAFLQGSDHFLRGVVGRHARTHQHLLNLRKVGIDQRLEPSAGGLYCIHSELNTDLDQAPQTFDKAHGCGASALPNGFAFFPQFMNAVFHLELKVLCIVFAPAGQQNSGHFNQCFSAFVLGAASLVCKQFGFTGPVNAVGVEQVFLRVGCQRYFYHQQIASECGRSLPFAASHEKTIGIHVALHQAKVGKHFAIDGVAGARARKPMQHQFIEFGVVDRLSVQRQPG